MQKPNPLYSKTGATKVGDIPFSMAALSHAAPNILGTSSRSSGDSISNTLPTSLVFRISSLAPAYSIRISLLLVMGR